MGTLRCNNHGVGHPPSPSQMNLAKPMPQSPCVLAAEIAENLQDALEQFTLIASAIAGVEAKKGRRRSGCVAILKARTCVQNYGLDAPIKSCRVDGPSPIVRCRP